MRVVLLNCVCDTQKNKTQCFDYAKCAIKFTTLSDDILIVIMLTVIMLTAIMLIVVVLNRYTNLYEYYHLI